MSTLRGARFQRENASVDDRIRLDFDEHFRVDEVHENHGRGGQNVAENLAVRAPDRFPEGRIPHEHARAHDVPRLGSCFTQSMDDDGQAAFRLCVGITGCDDAAIIVHRRGAGDEHEIAAAHRA